MRGNPNGATSARYFTGDVQDRLERQVTPLTPEYRRERVRLARRGLGELRRFDRSRLTDGQRVSAELMEWQLESLASGEAFDDLTFPLEQNGGANVNLVNTLTVNHPLRTEKDAENYLARLALVGTRMVEAIADARRIATRGTIPPRFILDATITQLQQFVSGAPGQNPFVTAFDERLRAAGAVPDARRAELRAAAEKIAASQVYPAWQRAIALLQEQLPLSTNDAGLWRLKGGDAAYAYHLRRFTTTSLTAEQIHEIGLREVERIEREMDAILRTLGRTEGSVTDRVEQLRRDLAYPLTEQGRTMIVELREKARAALGPRFSLQAYHNVVLGAGTVPLQILESEVDRYIQAAGTR
jgi:uncharacterized protein (DUF885 family)